MNITITTTTPHYHVTINAPYLFERCALPTLDIAQNYFGVVQKGITALFGLVLSARDLSTSEVSAFDLHDAAGEYQGEALLTQCSLPECAVFHGISRLAGVSR